MANRLKDEQSPYLLQHANNPVDWYPWGDEAFEKAKAEHKPLIVSIGYAACHWCHVMEHESFEDKETAAYMNEHFVCIKVDREEHPDVDHIYMDAVQAISGSGGWPLNVFVTPERAPFYGGTYYPPRAAFNRPSWMQLMARMNEVWTTNQDEVAQQAGQMIAHLKQASLKSFTTTEKTIDKDTCRRIADTLLQQADKEYGGFGNAPKFPGTMAISFLLEHYHFTGYEPALKQALRSLDAMIEGGIYDQLGGGFARYSTDREWLAPHFEKMLYDNALLISALCDGYSITKNVRYKEVIEETIAFAERELKDESGGYYCALDADSEGVEGKFYTFTWDEWVDALQPFDPFDGAQDDPFDEAQDDNMLEEYFGVRREGNWEGTNILHVAKSIAALAIEHGVAEDVVVRRIADAKQKLWAARAKRIRPQTDDKSLLSWNALMNIALAKAGVVLQYEPYLQRATAHIQWMVAAFEKEGLLHTWKNGTAKITAKLDDHAYLVQAMLQLASATGEAQWVVKAATLTGGVLAEFADAGGYFYYTAAHQSDMPVRKIDVYDGATPSANAVMAHNLWICGMCMEQPAYIAQAVAMLHNMSDTVARYSYSFGYWATLLQRHVMGMKTLINAGKGADEIRKELQREYIPGIYALNSVKKISEVAIMEKKFFEDKTCIFVCTEQACLSPVSTVNDALSLLSQ